jgi:hypothetical protein
MKIIFRDHSTPKLSTKKALKKNFKIDGIFKKMLLFFAKQTLSLIHDRFCFFSFSPLLSALLFNNREAVN